MKDPDQTPPVVGTSTPRSAPTGWSDRSSGAPVVGVRPLRVEELPEAQRIDLAHSGMDKAIFWERVRDEFFGDRRNRFRFCSRGYDG